MDDKTKAAFEFAKDTTKQLITLSSAIIALTITFSKDFIGNVDLSTKNIALFAWGAFLVSIIFGLWTLMALTGTLEPKDTTTPVSIRGSNVTIPALLQIILFITGMALTILFAVKALETI